MVEKAKLKCEDVELAGCEDGEKVRCEGEARRSCMVV